MRPQPSSRRAVIAAIVAAIAICLLPLPGSLSELSVSAPGLSGSSETNGQVAVVGNSVMSHVSDCDSDRRPLTEMVADQAHRPVRDLAVPGQTAQASINLGAAALRRPEVSDVVVFLSAFQLSDHAYADLREQVYWRLVNGSLAVNDPVKRLAHSPSLAEQPPVNDQAFRYKGIDYPDYAGIKEQVFAPAKAGAGCPESLGQDSPAIEALYWNSYLRSPPNDAVIADLATLTHEADDHGKGLLVVLLPIDIDDIDSLDSDLANTVTRSADQTAARFREDSVATLDLSRSVPEGSAFADRWCACGHLGEEGRSIVAKQVGALLAARVSVQD